MKKTFVSLAIGILFCMGTAHAYVIPGNFWDGTLSPPNIADIQNVVNFDWSSSGSGNAVNSQGIHDAGYTFDFLYQANLIGFNDAAGAVITPPVGMNQSYEFTFVAKIPEVQVNNLIGEPFPQVAIFATAAPGSWALYYDYATLGGTSQSNIASGTGFNDGMLIASGDWMVGEVTSAFFATSQTAGIGSTTLHGDVNFLDTNFFSPDLATALGIIGIRFEGTLNLPPLDSVTASFFDGNDGYAVTPVGTNDLLFKVDASNKYVVPVPEPSSIILLGMGLLGLVGFSARKRIK